MTTNESKDRQALRACLAAIKPDASLGTIVGARAQAAEVLQSPDPCAALVEALGALCLEAHHFADNKAGEQHLRNAIARARNVLESIK